MGERGPLPRRAPTRERLLGTPGHRQPRASVVVLPSPAGMPALPDGLAAGAAVWAEAWAACPWLRPDRDRSLVEQLARLEVEAAGHRTALDADGWTLLEPIVTPTGAVAGERVVPHPREAMLRRCERQALAVRGLLALSPVGAARLGLDVVHAERELTGLDRLRANAARRKAAR